jgi:superfamily I DNA/RNA helicase
MPTVDAHRSMARRRSVQEFHNAMTKLLGIRAFGKLVPAILTPLSDCADDPGVRILAQYFAKQKGKEAAMTIAEVLENFEQERESGKFDTPEEELPDRVRVMTMHSAKGLEAKVVFVPALEDDLVPGQMGNLEERRRLFFVSITRAKQLLLLSWASQRVGREIHREGGRMLGKQRSRFLTEMGE